jgi:hypothetical protein
MRNETSVYFTLRWIRKHAFYLDADQCAELNEAVPKIRDAWHECDQSQIRIAEPPFEPHRDLDPSYLVDR